jgi:hypothetical protein
MLEDVAWWGIQTTTKNSGSGTYRDLRMREFHRRYFLLCLSMGILRKAWSLSTKDSKQTSNKRLQMTPYARPAMSCCKSSLSLSYRFCSLEGVMCHFRRCPAHAINSQDNIPRSYDKFPDRPFFTLSLSREIEGLRVASLLQNCFSSADLSEGGVSIFYGRR